MKNKTLLLQILAFAGGIPLLLQTRYVYNAWRFSPMDQHDWIFAVVFAISAIVALLLTRGGKPQFQKRVALGTLTLFCGYLACTVISLNSGALFAAMGFWWMLIWYVRGWERAYHLIPSFAILLLSLVSSTYWMCVFLGVTPFVAFVIKMGAMIWLLLLMSVTIIIKYVPRQGIVIFSVGLLAAVVTIFQLNNVSRTYPSLNVQFKSNFENYLGRELDADENFKRFFHYSDAHHYWIANDNDYFSLLIVNCGQNIHEIHPASHCLRSSGWDIESEEPYEFELNNKRYCVTEVKGNRGGNKTVTWVWYSDNLISTGNFICFRKSWNPDEPWASYQLGVSGKDDLDESRMALIDIMEKLLVAPKKD